MKEKKSVKMELLLLEDVKNLGKKGELAKAKPGFIRNFLLPQKKAVVADKRTIRMQNRLQEERMKQAIQDKKESEALATRLKDLLLSIKVKNDSQGHLYGSVGAGDIAQILQEQGGIALERKQVILSKPIKTVGVFEIELRLKENVPASFKLKIEGETKVQEQKTRIEVIEENTESAEEAAFENSEEGMKDLPMRSERQKEMKTQLDERRKK